MDTWSDTFESWGDALSEYLFPSPAETLRRAGSSIRSAVSKLERERKKLDVQEAQLMANAKRQESTATCFADLRPGLLAVAKARRSKARVDKMTLKMRGLQQQLIETEVNATTTEVMQAVTGALTQANAITGGAQVIQKTVMNYERQKALLQMAQESFAEDDEEEEEELADDMLARIAQEANLRLSFALPAVPPAPTQALAPVAVSEEDELFARLERLRR